jgi:RNA polymerase sigma factor (sigma-70 family)
LLFVNVEIAAVLEQNTLAVPSTVSETVTVDHAPDTTVTAKGEAPLSTPEKLAEPTPEPEDVGDLYVRHRMLLLFVACRKFRIPEIDAENLIQDVFLSFIQTGTKVENTRAWLVAAMCNASRHYWRAQGRTESLPDDIGERSDPGSHSLADKMAMKLTMRHVLGYMRPQCRETLRLHYYEGRSAADVGRELDTTTRYAEKLIHNCLKRAREIYLSLTAVKR